MAEYVHEPIKVGAGGDSGPVGGAKINKALEHILSRLTDLPAGAGDFSSPDFAKFGLFSYASLWAEVNKTNLYRNAATPVIDFHGLQTGKAALIAFGDKQNFTNGPNGIASGITGLVTISGNATDGGLTLFINSGPSSATGFWSKRVSGGTWGEWTYYSPDIWTDVTTAMSPFQASPGYRVRVGDGATLRLMNSGNAALIGVRVAPKTTWDKVPAITTTQSGWTVQDHPTAGSAEVVYLPDPTTKVWEMKGGSGAQASTANPNAVQQQPAAPIPSVSQPVWQITNANVGNLITYTGVREINSVTFNYTDPEDDTSTAVFSLSDLVTGFNPSGFYGGQARFIDVTMPSSKVVKVILVKNSATSLSIVVAKPGANLSVFGKIANVWITVVDAPVAAFKEAIYKVFSNADARQTLAAGGPLEFNTVAMIENGRAYADTAVLADNRIVCPDAGAVSVIAMTYANTAAARTSLVHYDAAGTIKRTYSMAAALASGENKETTTIPRIKVAAGDRFGLVGINATSAQFFRGEHHCEMHVAYLPS